MDAKWYIKAGTQGQINFGYGGRSGWEAAQQPQSDQRTAPYNQSFEHNPLNGVRLADRYVREMSINAVGVSATAYVSDRNDGFGVNCFIHTNTSVSPQVKYYYQVKTVSWNLYDSGEDGYVSGTYTKTFTSWYNATSGYFESSSVTVPATYDIPTNQYGGTTTTTTTPATRNTAWSGGGYVNTSYSIPLSGSWETIWSGFDGQTVPTPDVSSATMSGVERNGFNSVAERRFKGYIALYGIDPVLLGQPITAAWDEVEHDRISRGAVVLTTYSDPVTKAEAYWTDYGIVSDIDGTDMPWEMLTTNGSLTPDTSLEYEDDTPSRTNSSLPTAQRVGLVFMEDPEGGHGSLSITVAIEVMDYDTFEYYDLSMQISITVSGLPRTLDITDEVNAAVAAIEATLGPDEGVEWLYNTLTMDEDVVGVGFIKTRDTNRMTEAFTNGYPANYYLTKTETWTYEDGGVVTEVSNYADPPKLSFRKLTKTRSDTTPTSIAAKTATLGTKVTAGGVAYAATAIIVKATDGHSKSIENLRFYINGQEFSNDQFVNI